MTASWSSSEACTARLRGERRPLSERLWEKIDVRGPDECWPWLASVDSGGYGHIDDGTGILRKAHRLVSELCVGKPGTLHVLHRCDNPRCCNPAHLFLGTHADNMRDRRRKGRYRGSGPPQGERNPAARLTTDDVRVIRALRALGASTRAIATALAISASNVRLIASGRTWRNA